METREMYLTVGHPNRPGTKLEKVTGVVVHWTANEARGANAQANRNYFNRAYRMINGRTCETNKENGKDVAFRYASAHVNVDDSTAVYCLPWGNGAAEMGYHVGGTYKPGVLSKLGTTYPNDCTIGIEICVNADGDFSKAYWNAVGMTAWMLKEHDLGIDALIRHYDVTGKQCPGFFVQESYAVKYFGVEWTAEGAYQTFRNDVESELNASVAPQYFKVYQNDALYKYQFETYQGGVDCADSLFVESNGTDGSIYVESPAGEVVYNPSCAPEKFPQFQKSEEQKIVDNLSDDIQAKVYTILKKKFG